MKKSKLSIGLVTSFIATMALTACGADVTKNATNILDFKGYGDQDLSVITDEIYDDYKKSASGIAKYYDQVIEVLIRKAFKDDQKTGDVLRDIKKNYNQIVNEAENNVKGAKQTAKENADTNGTKYKTEWQAILAEKGVKDEEELLQYYIYQLEKEQIEDWYFDKNESELKKEYLGVKANAEGTGFVDSNPAATAKASSKYPYHIRHILVKVEDGANDFVRGTISADQAKLLSSTVELLAEGKMSFGEVAAAKSEDSSASEYGDVGIVDISAGSGSLSMVNEFQLGAYVYDAVFKNGGNTDEASLTINKGLGLDIALDPTNPTQTVKKTLKDAGIAEVPYSVFVELGKAAAAEKSLDGYQVEDGKAAIFPRNILWNKYLNQHNAFVITNVKPEAFDSSKTLSETGSDKYDVRNIEHVAGDYSDSQVVGHYLATDTDTTINFTQLTRFQTNSLLNGGKILCDENNNVIIGVRSQYGIHLMLVQKSAYDFNDGKGDKVSLEDYYTTAVPGDSDYPVYDDTATKAGADKETYVNFISSVNKSEYNSRAEKVRSAIKGFDSTYDYRLYEYLTTYYSEQLSDDTKGKALLGDINNYIKLQREKNLDNQTEGLKKVWRTYSELLELQEEYRSTAKRMVPEGCKIAFKENLRALDESVWKEGGACYVK